jgi:hypothetical protein
VVSYAANLPPELRDPERKDEIIEYLRMAHGDIEDAKVSLIFISDELGFDLSVDDVASVTDEPPTETFV